MLAVAGDSGGVGTGVAEVTVGVVGCVAVSTPVVGGIVTVGFDSTGLGFSGFGSSDFGSSAFGSAGFGSSTLASSLDSDCVTAFDSCFGSSADSTFGCSSVGSSSIFDFVSAIGTLLLSADACSPSGSFVLREISVMFFSIGAKLATCVAALATGIESIGAETSDALRMP